MVHRLIASPGEKVVSPDGKEYGSVVIFSPSDAPEDWEPVGWVYGTHDMLHRLDADLRMILVDPAKTERGSVVILLPEEASGDEWEPIGWTEIPEPEEPESEE
jgi:hypothetical protein